MGAVPFYRTRVYLRTLVNSPSLALQGRGWGGEVKTRNKTNPSPRTEH
jgi:hypothetical protein